MAEANALRNTEISRSISNYFHSSYFQSPTPPFHRIIIILRNNPFIITNPSNLQNSTSKQPHPSNLLHPPKQDPKLERSSIELTAPINRSVRCTKLRSLDARASDTRHRGALQHRKRDNALSRKQRERKVSVSA